MSAGAVADAVGIEAGGEFRRRLVHVCGTLIPAAYLLALVPWSVVAGFCIAGTVVAAALEALRLSGRVDWRIFDELTREYEADNPAGYALYAVGFAVVAVALGPATTPATTPAIETPLTAATTAPIAVPAMLMLSIGDPISGVLGSADASGRKNAAVLAVMFLVCLSLSVPFVALPAAAAGAAVATVADGVKPVVRGYVIDDNVTIPIGAGLATWAVLALA